MTDEGGDFYSVLGVARSASTDTIRRAYRDRAKETHPDVADEADAAARFRRVKRAHEVLVDPSERARYDRLGHEGYLAAERLDTEGDPGAEAEPTESTAPSDGPDRRAGSTRTGHAGTARTGAASRTDRRRAHGTAANGGGRPGYGPRRGARRRGRRARRSDDGDVGSVRMGAARWVRFATALLEAWQSQLTASSGPLALAVFVAYPVFLGSTVAPWFPPSVNAIVGICTLFVVAYLVLRPELGIPVFGGWLALLPVALSVAGLGVLSISGALAFLLTAVPLALCVSSLLAGTTL
jgi:curved DNA-binding protein CbpA